MPGRAAPLLPSGEPGGAAQEDERRIVEQPRKRLDAGSDQAKSAILDPRNGELSVVGPVTEDMFSGGWGPDARAVTKETLPPPSYGHFGPWCPERLSPNPQLRQGAELLFSVHQPGRRERQ
jgi:hypothetical protein